MVITNQGKIVFTYQEAEELGIRSSRTFFKALRELVEERGFIDVEEGGSWYFSKATKFSISERWRKFGTPAYQPVKIPRRLPDSVGFQKEQKDQDPPVPE